MSEQDREEAFYASWKQWVRRVPTRSPKDAATEVAASIRSRRAAAQRRTHVLAAAAVIAAAVGLAAFWVVNHSATLTPTPVARAADPLADGAVLIWLDPETPLYMTFQSPEGTQRIGGKP